MESKLPYRVFRDAKTDIQNGAHIEIECVEDAERRGPAWHGSWQFTVVSKGQRLQLVTARLDIRRVSTVSGVVSLARDFGFDQATIPFVAEQKAVWRNR